MTFTDVGEAAPCVHFLAFVQLAVMYGIRFLVVMVDLNGELTILSSCIAAFQVHTMLLLWTCLLVAWFLLPSLALQVVCARRARTRTAA